uniref:NADH-ubiquinone oxidoreductase chain 2 n=1 Tax=Paraspadella gotoi TaxID=34758 RepID=Q6E0V9_PARGO|nr:NADH dehydrogenase subunit 2 [Paraspadella gotoi]AAT12173.1 NADH dehydrogenase subunit 2 [Paraspadella gotoi]
MMGMVLGTLMVISTSSWVVLWMGMEVNLMSFIPFLKKQNAMTYFIIQSVGSLMILFGGVYQFMSSMMFFLLLLGIITKMGLMPLHFWVPLVMKFNPPQIFLLLLSWQKLNPLILLSFLPNSMFIIIFINSLLGGFFSLLSSSIPTLIMFSGFVHWSWILSLISSNLHMMYFSVYMIIIFFLYIYYYKSYLFMMSLLNFAGVPPMPGFFLKLFSMMFISKNYIFFLLMGSVLMLTAYIRSMMIFFKEKSHNYNGILFMLFFMLLPSLMLA